MLSSAQYESLARELDEAERSRVQVEQFSMRYPDMTVEDSYAIQRAWVARKCARGRRIIGHKIGLTSRAMQLASQITEPDFGALLDDMLIADASSVEAREGSSCLVSRWSSPSSWRSRSRGRA